MTRRLLVAVLVLAGCFFLVDGGVAQAQPPVIVESRTTVYAPTAAAPPSAPVAAVTAPLLGPVAPGFTATPWSYDPATGTYSRTISPVAPAAAMPDPAPVTYQAPVSYVAPVYAAPPAYQQLPTYSAPAAYYATAPPPAYAVRPPVIYSYAAPAYQPAAGRFIGHAGPRVSVGVGTGGCASGACMGGH